MTSPLHAATIALFLLATAAHADSPNLIKNGNFEAPVVTVGGWQTFSGTTAPIPGWKVTSGSVDITSARYFASRTGRQSLDLNALEPGTIAQTVPTKPGQTYLLTFAFAANPIMEKGRKVMEVLWNDHSLGKLECNTTDRTGKRMGWQTLTCAVTARGTDTLTFRSLTPGCAGPALDKISLTPLPASATGKHKFSF